LLTQAKTLRTAGILLDQMNGAFTREVSAILDDFKLDRLQQLASYASLGTHLTSSWRIAIAGQPNVGKSSLINALLGFERAVVSPIAGTTRDVVASNAAFEGWPIELLDTAGLRDSTDELESLGIERARSVLQSVDLVIWVQDTTQPFRDSEWPNSLLVANKCDLAPAPPGMLAVSAKTGDGVATLINTIVRRLVPHDPPPGAAVPYTPELAVTVSRACTAATAGNIDEARTLLAACLSGC
jgi:tRNA modification GTPase